MAFAADGETAAAAPDNNMGIGMIAAVTADTLTFMLTVVGAYRIYKVK